MTDSARILNNLETRLWSENHADQGFGKKNFRPNGAFFDVFDSVRVTCDGMSI